MNYVVLRPHTFHYLFFDWRSVHLKYFGVDQTLLVFSKHRDPLDFRILSQTGKGARASHVTLVLSRSANGYVSSSTERRISNVAWHRWSAVDDWFAVYLLDLEDQWSRRRKGNSKLVMRCRLSLIRCRECCIHRSVYPGMEVWLQCTSFFATLIYSTTQNRPTETGFNVLSVWMHYRSVACILVWFLRTSLFIFADL
jgi:hypothetical protein